MKESLKKRTDLFVGNELTLMKKNKWDSFTLIPVVASIYTEKGLEVDMDRLKACKDIVDTKTSILSNFRGNLRFPMAAALSVTDDPKKAMDEAIIYYDMIKEQFMSSPYTALVAGSLGKLTTVNEAPKYIAKGRMIYDGMKRQHPLLTNGQDSVLAVLLAFSDKTQAAILDEMELLFKGVNDYVSAADTIQSVSNVLAITDENYQIKLDKFKKIARTFMPEGKNYKLGVEAISLAALSLLPIEAETIIEDLRDVEAFLKTKKNYGFFGYSRHDRRAHAAMILSAQYADELGDSRIADVAKTAEVASTLAILAAQQAAMCTVVGATACTTAVSGK